MNINVKKVVACIALFISLIFILFLLRYNLRVGNKVDSNNYSFCIGRTETIPEKSDGNCYIKEKRLCSGVYGAPRSSENKFVDSIPCTCEDASGKTRPGWLDESIENTAHCFLP